MPVISSQVIVNRLGLSQAIGPRLLEAFRTSRDVAMIFVFILDRLSIL